MNKNAMVNTTNDDDDDIHTTIEYSNLGTECTCARQSKLAFARPYFTHSKTHSNALLLIATQEN